MKRTVVLSVIIFIALCISNTVKAERLDFYTTSTRKDVIRVGWYKQSSYMENNNGEHIGFCRAYLDKIADYANYEYEFIEGDFEYLYQLLKKGDIDIIPLMAKYPWREDEFYFTHDIILENIYVYADINSSKKTVIENYAGGSIGYYSEEHKIRLREFAKIKEIDFTYYKYISLEDANKAMLENKVDLAVTDEIRIESNQFLVDKIIDSKMSLAISKSRKDVLNSVNNALLKIELENPYFTELLMDEYLKVRKVTFYLTPKEKEILRKYPRLKVAIDNHGIYQFFDTATQEFRGIDIEILNKISKITGIEFIYVSVDSKKLFELKVDLIGSVDKNEKYIRNYGYRMTTPYLVMNLVSLQKVDTNVGVDATRGIYYKMNTLFIDAISSISYDNLNNMFQEFMKGEVKEVIMTSLNADHIIRRNGLEGIIRIPITELEFRNCIAIREDLPIELLSVLNRAILSIEDNEIHELIANDDIFNERNVLSIIKEHPVIVILFTLIVFGTISLFFTIIIRREQRHKRELLILAKQDSMTRLLNKIAIETEIEKTISHMESNKTYALSLIDIDYFKSINDTYGHAVGDDVIIRFSELLKKYFSDKGMIGRIGGDEFIVFMEISEEFNEIEHFINSGELKQVINGISLEICVSIGISLYPYHGKTFMELYKSADQALYEVKNSGRANYKMAGYPNPYKQ